MHLYLIQFILYTLVAYECITEGHLYLSVLWVGCVTLYFAIIMVSLL